MHTNSEMLKVNFDCVFIIILLVITLSESVSAFMCKLPFLTKSDSEFLKIVATVTGNLEMWLCDGEVRTKGLASLCA